MSRPSHTRTIWTPLLLGFAGMAVAMVLGQAVIRPRTAIAQVPDSGAQRKAMIAELKEVNKKLDDMTKLLRELRDLEKADSGDAKKGKSSRR